MSAVQADVCRTDLTPRPVFVSGERLKPEAGWGHILTKSVIGAWFLTLETSNTSAASGNLATMMLMGM